MLLLSWEENRHNNKERQLMGTKLELLSLKLDLQKKSSLNSIVREHRPNQQLKESKQSNHLSLLPLKMITHFHLRTMILLWLNLIQLFLREKEAKETYKD